MRNRLRLWLRRIDAWLRPPPPDQASTIRTLTDTLSDYTERERSMRAEYVERAAELIEARQMAGAGPWLVHESRGLVNSGATGAQLRESNPLISQGAFGDIELALQNVEWRREVNLSWLEFTRWGIQQIILISRLYYVKNPIIRRLIDIAACYVFARGVEVSSSDPDAQKVLTDFFDRNKKTLGQIALVKLERQKYYDGNLFFAFFADTEDTGLVNVRTIDATEIMDIICNPDDSDVPWFYRRSWTQRVFDERTGTTQTQARDAWYPALGYEPPAKVQAMNGVPVMWGNPVLHRRCGEIAKWHFGCPIIYPALNWAKASKEFLEACATVKKALAQIATTITTKGGQQALAGIKSQLQTNVGTGSSLWDTNPPAIAGSMFASGPGTKIEAFKTMGAGGDPEEVRQFKLMCCMVVGVPETFLADVSTGNLATATTLDRPTETCFLEKQEAWVEDLVTIARYVLSVSKAAPSGQLREALIARKIEPLGVAIREAPKKMVDRGGVLVSIYEAAKPTANLIDVRANFPAIREGDVPALVSATVQSMTLGGSNGVIGIDEKAGVRHLYDLLGMEGGDDTTEEQYPEGSYDPDRTSEPSVQPTATKEARRMVRDLIESVSK